MTTLNGTFKTGEQTAKSFRRQSQNGLAAAAFHAGLARAIAGVVIRPRVMGAGWHAARESIRCGGDGHGKPKGRKCGQEQILHFYLSSPAGARNSAS